MLSSALLGVLVVIAAGVSGTAHFAGPRWVPDWKIRRHAQAPRKLPTPARAAPPPTTTRHGTGGFPVGVVIWVVVGIAAIAVAALLWRLWAGRRAGAATIRRPALESVTSEIPVEPEPEPDMPALRTGIELALQALDEHREPGDAIVRAWLGLEETAEQSGIVRGAAETPTEFTSRILSRALRNDRAVATLLRLYLKTRFGDHPATADDVAAVRAALQELVRTWPALKSPAGAGRG